MTCIDRRNGRGFTSLHTTAAARALITSAVAVASVLPTLPAQAAPAGYRIIAGAGSIRQDGLTTTITQPVSQTQQPARMVINWNIFSSAAGEHIVFDQPNAAAIVLNRVTGASPSELMGTLTAKGQVFILNPNGVLFGAGSQVDVRGLLASTLGMDTDGFMAGTYALQGSSSGRVVNQGSLKALEGGYIALVGQTVVNDRSISASKGDALLAAGDTVTLRLEGGSLLGYSITLGSANALVANRGSGVIRANGGRVVLEARAGAEALSKAVVNHDGVIEAQTLESSKGSIKLIGDRDVGQANVSGTLDASAPNGGDGGFIETSAAQVKIADSTKVTTKKAVGTPGTWQINANDFEIAADSGARTASSIGATTLANALQNLDVANSNVAIATNPTGAGSGQGDITVNGTVAWQGFGKLTLQARRNIIFNASLGGASVSLLYGQGSDNGNGADFYFNKGAKIFLNGVGGTFDTQKGSKGDLKIYTIVRSLGTAGTEGTANGSTLQGISELSNTNNYALGTDITATDTSGWNKGAGFTPLGQLNGTFEGLGHEISGLTIKRPDSSIFGLFTAIGSGAVVHNLNITKADINGVDRVAILAGINLGTIQNVYVTGKVVGTLRTGGLVGANSGTISSSHSDANVKGSRIAGGLVGENSIGVISDSNASGAVSAGDPNGAFLPDGPGYAGGLVGFNRAQITGSYSNATTAGTVAAGGLVGGNMGIIDNSYANGSVNANTWVGGLVGEARAGSNIKNTYATGAVTGTASVGGLVGKAETNTVIENTYATGAVSGSSNSTTTHGLVGEPTNGTVSNSYWNTDAVADGGTGQTAPGAGVGKTGAQLQQAATFSGWDMATTGGTDKVWRIYEGKSKPLLRSLLAPLVLETVRSEYSAAEQQGPAIPSVNNRAGVAASGRTAGTHLPYSTSQQGYDISNGELVITPYRLTLTATVPGKVYDGNRQASVTLDATPLSTDTVTATHTTAAFDNKNVGNEKVVTVSGITLGGKDAGNYTFTPPPTTTASITPRPLDITATAADKVYDGTTLAKPTLQDDRRAGDALATSAVASFDDRNAGAGKKVTVSGIAVAGADAGNYLYEPHALTTSASITPRAIDITATAADKAYDGTTQTSATLADNRLAGDAVAASYQRADFADKNGGQKKPVIVSGIAISGADAGNYQANASTTTSASSRPLSLTIAANSDTRLADGVPYRGGNGVTYAGLLPGETAAVLAGQLRYGGDAQGAMKEGVYRIAPGGLTSLNYASTFVDGALTIQPLPPGAGVVAAYTEPAIPAAAAYVGRNTGARTLQVVDCGMRLPENLLVGGCQSASQPGISGR